jgi:hypothetical protein
MLTIESTTYVDAVFGREITEFLLSCTDSRYQSWWPGTHLAFHTISRGRQDHTGDVVVMDEYIGRRRVRLTGVVVQAVPGERITWRLAKTIRLPVRLTLELTPQHGGLALRHTITAGWSGPGRMLDPLFRCYFTRAFTTAMHQHVHTEFALLRDHLVAARAHPCAKAGSP